LRSVVPAHLNITNEWGDGTDPGRDERATGAAPAGDPLGSAWKR